MITLHPDYEVAPEAVVDILKKEKGQIFRANWTGATDKYTAGDSSIIQINRGTGFEKAVAVKNNGEMFIYMQPFKIINMPDEKSMLLFSCSDALFIKF